MGCKQEIKTPMIVGSDLAVLVKCLLFQGSDKFQNWGSPAFLNVIDGSTVELSSLLSALYASNVVNIGVIICKTNLPVSFEDRE